MAFRINIFVCVLCVCLWGRPFNALGNGFDLKLSITSEVSFKFVPFQTLNGRKRGESEGSGAPDSGCFGEIHGFLCKGNQSEDSHEVQHQENHQVLLSYIDVDIK